MTNGSRSLELPAGPFAEDIVAPQTAAAAVYKTFVDAARKGVGDYVLSPDFDAGNMVHVLHGGVEAARDSIVMATLAREARWGLDDKDDLARPLKRYLGTAAVSGEAVRIGDDFVADLHAQLDGLPYGFEKLGKWREALDRTEILQAARRIKHLEVTDDGSGAWVGSAFMIARHTIENPSDYTLPPDSTDALYLTTFMPQAARKLLRRTMVGHAMLGRTRERIGSTITVHESAAIDALGRFYTHDALSGQQWDDLIKQYGDTGDLMTLSLALAHHSTERIRALGDLQQLVQRGHAGSMLEAWEAARQEFDERMQDFDRDVGDMRIWQSQDVGHCFGSFTDWDIEQAFSGRYRTYEVGEEQKTGRTALILEDDSQQRHSYAGMVNGYTKFMTDESLCVETPQAARDRLADPDIGLFIIDIQNGDDETAGIHVANEIFDLVMARAATQALDEAPQIRLVVWSASSSAAKMASDFFEQKIAASQQDVSYDLVGSPGMHSSSSPLYVDIRLKRWDASIAGR